MEPFSALFYKCSSNIKWWNKHSNDNQIKDESEVSVMVKHVDRFWNASSKFRSCPRFFYGYVFYLLWTYCLNWSLGILIICSRGLMNSILSASPRMIFESAKSELIWMLIKVSEKTMKESFMLIILLSLNLNQYLIQITSIKTKRRNPYACNFWNTWMYFNTYGFSKSNTIGKVLMVSRMLLMMKLMHILEKSWKVTKFKSFLSKMN